MQPKIDIPAVLEKITFNDQGIVPVVAQDQLTGDVLMLAWMNRDAVQETLTTGRICYWSRSRKTLWRKGETSGNIQTLREFYIDCDGDTILLKVHQIGPACHTGAKTCFFTKI